jgi:hypothetical protein
VSRGRQLRRPLLSEITRAAAVVVLCGVTCGAEIGALKWVALVNMSLRGGVSCCGAPGGWGGAPLFRGRGGVLLWGQLLSPPPPPPRGV